MGIKSELGQKIRRMRQNRGMTQEELSEKVNISQRTLSGIETGENFLTAETFDNLIAALNTTYEDLFATNHYKSPEVLVAEIDSVMKLLIETENFHDLEILYNVAKSLIKE